jgi:hypothetical protein
MFHEISFQSDLFYTAMEASTSAYTASRAMSACCQLLQAEFYHQHIPSPTCPSCNRKGRAFCVFSVAV